MTQPSPQPASPSASAPIAPPTPRCAHFGHCGGCQYQDLPYPAQLTLKQATLRDHLLAAGLVEIPEIVPHSSDPWHYRNRIRLRLARIAGTLRFGYNRANAAGPEAFLPIAECPIAAPLLLRAAQALAALDTTLTGPARLWLDAATEVELFTNATETWLQLTLFARNAPKAGFPDVCQALQLRVPELTGAGAAILPAQLSGRSRRAEHPKPGPTWGAEGLLYTLTSAASTEPETHWITRGAFFQTNRFLLETLDHLATAARTGALAWDLYAGVGLFTRALAAQFDQVVAVEAAEPAATGLARSLKGTLHRAVASTTLDFLQSAVLQRDRPDLILMDPPRAGVGPEVCALLARLRAPKIVYVSCDPLTLARDLALLIPHGYHLTELHLVDMFPQTFHMEAVAILHREALLPPRAPQN
jgi:23S rRNA (uracil1939-C5)-methyltransferase